MKNYGSWLVEKETAKSCREKFQKVLFGEFRGLEKDTPLEAEMYQKILKWLATMNPTGDSSAKAAIEVFNTLKDCRQYYRKELIPTAKKAYRGKIVPVKEIMGGSPKISRDISMNMIGQIRAEGYIDTMFRIAMVESGKMSMNDMQGAEGFMKAMQERQKVLGKSGTEFVNVSHTFKPSKLTSSWSTEFGHAMNFAFSDDMSYSRKRYDPKYVAVIVEIPVDENFVMNNKFMNMLGREAGHSYGEDEMIRVSKKPIKGKVHFLHGSRKIAEMLK